MTTKKVFKLLNVFVFTSLIITCQLSILNCFSQGIAVNTSGAAADDSAILDLSTISQGILIPRMTEAQRNAIPSPAESLLIYNTTSERFNYFKSAGTAGWYELSSGFLSSAATGINKTGGGIAINEIGALADSSAILDIYSTSRRVLIPRTTSLPSSPVRGLIIYYNNSFQYFNGSSWKTICETYVSAASTGASLSSLGVSINTTGYEAVPSAMLDVNSNNSGLLIPRMTCDERNLILPKQGLMIYNLTDNTLNYSFENGSYKWYELETDTLPEPNTISGLVTVCSGQTGVAYSIDAITGATSYTWSGPSGTVLTPVSPTTSLSVTAAFGSASGDISVIANNACGASAPCRMAITVNSTVEKGQFAYGGTGDDVGMDIKQTSDGGYIMAGYTNSFGAGGNDVYVVKTDSFGNLQWSKTYGGAANDYANCILQTSDGGFIIGGGTSSFGSSDAIYIIKTDDSGAIVWTKTYDGGSNMEAGSGAQKIIEDGGSFVVAANTFIYDATWVHYEHYDWAFFKIDVSGSVIWANKFASGGATNDLCSNVIKTNDGGYLFSGHSSSPFMGLLLIKTNNAGSVTWANSYNLPGNWSNGGGLIQDSNGDYVISGSSDASGLFLTKINIAGTMIFCKYGTAGYLDRKANLLIQSSDGSYMVTGGYSGSLLLIKYTQSGEITWAKNYGNTSSTAESVIQNMSNGFAMVGYTNSFGVGGTDFFLVITDNTGASGCSETLSSLYSSNTTVGSSAVSTGLTSFTTGSGATETSQITKKNIQCTSCP